VSHGRGLGDPGPLLTPGSCGQVEVLQLALSSRASARGIHQCPVGREITVSVLCAAPPAIVPASPFGCGVSVVTVVPEWCERLCWGHTDLMRVLCFSRGHFVVVCVFNALVLMEGHSRTGLWTANHFVSMCLKKEKVLLEVAACCILAISGAR
jgi:hypothetical protein